MRTIRLHSLGDLPLLDELIPRPGLGETLVYIEAVGICGSDIHWFSEGGIGDAVVECPLVLGHEFDAELENGQRVAVDPAIPCRQCEFCLRGHPNLCPEVRFAGHSEVDGVSRLLILSAVYCWLKTPNLFKFLPFPHHRDCIKC